MNQKQAELIYEKYAMADGFSCRIIQASYDDGKTPSMRETGEGDDIAVLVEYKRDNVQFFPSGFLRNKIDFKIKLFRYSDFNSTKGHTQLVLIV